MTANGLSRITADQIRLAGPRYTPGTDSRAPNLQIQSLLRATEALQFNSALAETLGDLKAEIRKGWKDAPTSTKNLLPADSTPQQLVNLLDTLIGTGPGERIADIESLGTGTAEVCGELQKQYLQLIDNQASAPDGSAERHHLESEAHYLRQLIERLDELRRYVDGAPYRLLTKNLLLLLGDWGTGKTHFLCDISRNRIAAGLPTLLVLAYTLGDEADPLRSICRIAGAKSTDDLLKELQRLGEKKRQRALLIVDGVNEGSIAGWKRVLTEELLLKIEEHPNVGVVFSCRRPFDREIFKRAIRKHFVEVTHPGFGDAEFDAQVEFFSHYDIPIPEVPLLTPEFGRPLFLKLFCEAIKNLGTRSKKAKLREIASGQKGMTYLLEYFIKSVGNKIETEFKLPSLTCWNLIKGKALAHKEFDGLAPRLAASLRDSVTVQEAIDIAQKLAGISAIKSRRVIKRMIQEGILIEGTDWQTNAVVVRLPYQRFSDHIIARHLLVQNLNTTSESTIRRSFYKNRPLGRVFNLRPGGWSYEMPGIASALMLEFPERVKKKLPHNERELVFYLPQARRLARPLQGVFLDGLHWRSSDSFTQQTDRLVDFFLHSAETQAKDETLHALVELAARPSHPYRAQRLYRYLEETFSMAERDLFWTEFVRGLEDDSIIFRLLEWTDRNAHNLKPDTAENTARLFSLFLTSTRRPLRDRVTYALFLIGKAQPETLFSIAKQGLAFNDPYVPERLLAACYGAAMSLWADPCGGKMRAALPAFAGELVNLMFKPDSPYWSRHTLLRGYALGIIELGRKVDERCVSRRSRRWIRPPFAHLPSPFVDSEAITDESVAVAAKALHMDFENYTVGRLIPDRGNYDSKHPEYRAVLKQIKRRMIDLGYSHQFASIDQMLGSWSWRQGEGEKTDRYGKKYSWISYFEMYGLRSDFQLLPERKQGERSSDCDLDPSFPTEPKEWQPPLASIFERAPADMSKWLLAGPTPDYTALLKLSEVDGEYGPWVLIDGFVEEAAQDARRVFTFLQGFLGDTKSLNRLVRRFEAEEYPGNSKLPEESQEFYTFAGEIPWSPTFGFEYGLRTKRGRARRHVEKAFMSYRSGHWAGIRVEVPTYRFAWESYHSTLNQVSGVCVPAPALCERLALVRHDSDWDLFQTNGRRATVYREHAGPEDTHPTHLLYLRADLLQRYLTLTRQEFVWIMWGERDMHYEAIHRYASERFEAYKSHAMIHKEVQWL